LNGKGKLEDNIGKRICPNGDKYEGEWKDDKMNGKGKAEIFYYRDTLGMYRNEV